MAVITRSSLSIASKVLSACVLAVFAGAALAQTPDAGAPGASGADIMALPRDLSPWGMFLSADPLVKAVLIGLAFASVFTWTVWLAKTVELVLARRRVRVDMATLGAARRLADGVERLAATPSPTGEFLAAAMTEIELSQASADRDGIKER